MRRRDSAFDYVIAGAGSAGCALAVRLAEYEPDAQILLVEAGGSGRSLFTRMPAGNGILIGNPKFDWGFTSVPQTGMNGGHIYYPRGFGVGGSSLLNGMIYIRGNPADYDTWAEMGLANWSYANVLPYFKRSAGAPHRDGDPYHNSQGPMMLSPARNHIPIADAFLQACQQAGIPFNPDFNGTSQNGVGILDAKSYSGVRQSSAEAYLSQKPNNITVKTGTRVLGIEFEGNRASGLKLSSGFVRAKSEVLICMGAFQSPHLLMLSGIGPAEHLRDHAIDVRVDLPGVGSRLFDHPNMPMQFDIKDKQMSMARYQRIDRAVWLGLQYLWNQSGPGGGPFWSVVLFTALRNEAMPELETFFTPMIVKEEAAGGGWNLQTLMNPGKAIFARGKTARPGFQLDVNLLRPKSHGTVRLASNDPMRLPLINPDYFSHPDDVKDLVAGVRRMREIVAQPVMNGVVGGELSPGINISNDREIENAVRQLATTGHHPVGTCAMGAENNPDAVLDSEFRVRGVEKLRVIDGSSMPTQVSGNVNAPIIMMAEKAADIIAGHAPLTPFDPRGAIDDD
ncbi:MAG: GMC family oxidoreductase N-terminal domain-containing protein [Pseudomonadota bacterium]